MRASINLRNGVPIIVLLLLPSCRDCTAQITGPVYQPMTADQRLVWFAKSTFGPGHLAFALLSSGVDTLRDVPPELGTHWQGYGERYGLRTVDRITSHGMEAGLGGLWGEDPRYYRVPEEPFRSRVAHVIRMTFASRNRQGQDMPAYARFIAVPTSSFLSNAWRPASDTGVAIAADRIGVRFGYRMAGNALKEFWPDIRRRLVHPGGAASPPTVNPAPADPSPTR